MEMGAWGSRRIATWMNRWMDGWMDERANEQMSEQIFGWVVRRIDKLVN